MNSHNMEWYQHNFDQMLQPELWADPVKSKSATKEKLLTEKLGMIANAFFQSEEQKEVDAEHQTSRQTTGNQRDLIKKFISLGIKRHWLTQEKISEFRHLAKTAGLIGTTERGRVRNTPQKSQLGRAIEKVLSKPMAKVEKRDHSPQRGYLKSTFESISRLIFPGEDHASKELIKACKNGNIKNVKSWLEKSADPNARDRNGFTPLHLAAMSNRPWLIEPLVQKGAKLEAKDKQGNTPLIHATMKNHLLTVKTLLNFGALMTCTNERGETLLHISSRKKNTTLLKYFLSKGMNINALDIKGQSPLFAAEWSGGHAAIKLLMESGADPSIIDRKGYTALSMLKSTMLGNFRKSAKHLKVPESVLPSKEIMRRKLLGHIVESGNKGDLTTRKSLEVKTIGLPHEGFWSMYQYKLIANSMSALSDKMPEIISQEFARTVRHTTALNMQFTQSSDHLMKQWMDHKPIIIDFGHTGHYTSILVWNDKFIYSNRGEGLSTLEYLLSQTAKVYTFNPSKFSQEIIDELQRHSVLSEKKSTKFIEDELPRALDFKKYELDKLMEMASLSPQVVGNCSWANAESAVLYLMILSGLREAHRRVDQIQTEEIECIIGEQTKKFRNWQAYATIHTLEKYLKWVKNKDNHFVPDVHLIDHSFNRLSSYFDIEPELKNMWQRLKTEWDNTLGGILAEGEIGKTLYHFGPSAVVKSLRHRYFTS